MLRKRTIEDYGLIYSTIYLDGFLLIESIESIVISLRFHNGVINLHFLKTFTTFALIPRVCATLLILSPENEVVSLVSDKHEVDGSLSIHNIS